MRGKWSPFKTGDCLIEVATWTGLTVRINLVTEIILFVHLHPYRFLQKI